MGILTKIFGDANEAYLKKLQPFVEKINSLEKEYEAFSDEKLKEKTQELKNKVNGTRVAETSSNLPPRSPSPNRAKVKTKFQLRLTASPSSAKDAVSLEGVLPEAFALVREAAKRTLRQRHFDVQLIGGIVLHQGKIAEMRTGEGKTLTATLPLYLNALEGKGCHLVTVNDYLAKRDAVWMGQIYHALGLSVGCITHETAYLYDPTAKQDAERDTLGGFKVIEDFLRPVSRREAYEADLTYGTNNEFGFDYLRDNMVYDLPQQVQSRLQSDRGSSTSLESGRGFNFAIVDEVDSILIDEARTPLIISSPDVESSKWYLDFARIIPRLDPKTDYEIDEKLRAVTLTEQGINRVEKILGLGNIYEEKGIKYLHHLEQALRAEVLFKKDRHYVVKQGQVIIVDEFTGRLMPGRRWSGGLHQAVEAKEGVRVQPESLTLASITFQNYFRMYKKLSGMTGTAVTSAEEFDKVYNLDVTVVSTNKPMVRQDLQDRVYKNSEGKFSALVGEIKERHKTGQPVLVGTTSIEKNEYLSKLLTAEGVPHQILNAKNHEAEGAIIAQAGKPGAVTIATNMAGRGVDIILGGNPQDPEQSRRVLEAGGLHVIGTERHEARRIDNQLRGRSGRQGDPGSSQFFISLEDDVMRIFGGDRLKSLMTALKIPEDQPIEAGLVSKAIEEAQSKIEGFNFDLRKHLLDYDDVMNKHREVIYKRRRQFLSTEDWKTEVGNWTKNEEEKKILEQKEKELAENFNQVAKFIALRTLDMLWMNHLEEMEALRDSVRLRAYGQRDPLVEYKNEGHKMFQNLLRLIETNIVQMLFRAQLTKEPKGHVHHPAAAPAAAKVGNKVGRNDPCPCGAINPSTGEVYKYKKCGLINAPYHKEGQSKIL
ncbi:MAG: preprotein translocase subunit SecA [Parcubacteria group bacterium Gr01-1014_30]|nr:MAG: preprotein translocase subunit SecA [Parcubacteria group bacterium Gr01-1014_30]